MPERTCGWCGASIEHMRPNALYCTLQHKKNAGSKRHRERNPGYYAKYTHSERRVEWTEANRERRRAYARRYQQNLPDRAERARKWREANREYFQLRERARRAAKFRNPGSVGVSVRDWKRLCRRYRNCCAYCEQPCSALQIEHVIPLAKGGRHAIGNILPACKDCNTRKNAALYVEWKYRKAYALAAELYGGTQWSLDAR